MNIVLGVLWQVVIDDVGDVVHMDASTRDIGSDKDLELTRFETFERLHSFFWVTSPSKVRLRSPADTGGLLSVGWRLFGSRK